MVKLKREIAGAGGAVLKFALSFIMTGGDPASRVALLFSAMTALGLFLVGPDRVWGRNAAYCVGICGGTCYSTPEPYKSGCFNRCVDRCKNEEEPPGKDSYGAVFVSSDGSGTFGFSYEWRNQVDALAEAAKQCFKQAGKPCDRLLIFVNRCAVVVRAKLGNDVAGFAGSAEPDQGEADARGVAECRQVYPGANCEIVKQFCSN